MATYNVVLQLLEVFVFNSPLGHRSEPRIDAIYDLVFRELLKKIITGYDLVPKLFRNLDSLTFI